MSTGGREMLGEAIRGKSNQEITEFVDNMGGEIFLDQAFDGMKEALNPERAQDAIIAYELTHRDVVFPYEVVVKNREAAIMKQRSSNARVTFRLSVPDYLRLITGQLPILRSIVFGRLKISGDRKFARSIESMFSS